MLQEIKNIYHLAQALFWRWYYVRPDKNMKIYGITGTNGKTTASYLLASVLQAEHGMDRVGMLTTISFWIGKHKKVNKTKMTTLPSRMVFRYLKKMKDKGVEYVVLELTSHALDQNRVAGISLDGGIILNLVREHLDYHKTMKRYARAKRKIVRYLKKDAVLIGKEDDKDVAKVINWASKRGVSTLSFTEDSARDVETSLVGDVNKENAKAVSLLAKAIGIDDEIIRRGINEVKVVPGRMEWIRKARSPRVLIDYAVTPDALDRVYKMVKSKTSGKIFAVIGAAGLRDRGKRALMTKAVAKYANEIIVTREDPWTENEEQIFSDLEKGLRATNLKWQRITNRRKAIRYCLQQANINDVIVVTGKGAEQGMAIGRKIVPWNDREVIESLIDDLRNSEIRR